VTGSRCVQENHSRLWRFLLFEQTLNFVVIQILDLVQEIRTIRGVHGVHLMAYRQEETVAEIIERSGVLNGRVPWYPGRDPQANANRMAS